MFLTRIYVAIIALGSVYGNEVLMEERTFCGDHIKQTLQKFCIVYFTPDHRAKRQIVDECCKKACSTYYIMSNFCKHYDEEELTRYVNELNELRQMRSSPNEELKQMDSKRRRRRRRASRRGH